MKTKTNGISLSFVWGIRLRLRAEGDKLRAEGDKLYAEGDKLCAEGNKLRAEGNKLWAEGNKLYAEGDKLWAEAILELYGNITSQWENGNCTLATGEIFNND